MIHAREDYNRIQDPLGKIGADEPVFLIRSTDAVGPATIKIWVLLVEVVGAHASIIEHANDHACLMEEWQAEHLDDVHVPDLPQEETK